MGLLGVIGCSLSLGVTDCSPEALLRWSGWEDSFGPPKGGGGGPSGGRNEKKSRRASRSRLTHSSRDPPSNSDGSSGFGPVPDPSSSSCPGPVSVTEGRSSTFWGAERGGGVYRTSPNNTSLWRPYWRSSSRSSAVISFGSLLANRVPRRMTSSRRPYEMS